MARGPSSFDDSIRRGGYAASHVEAAGARAACRDPRARGADVAANLARRAPARSCGADAVVACRASKEEETVAKAPLSTCPSARRTSCTRRRSRCSARSASPTTRRPRSTSSSRPARRSTATRSRPSSRGTSSSRVSRPFRKTVLLAGRRPEDDRVLGEWPLHTTTDGIQTYVYDDLTGERREGTRRTSPTFVKLGDALAEVDAVWPSPQACDVDPYMLPVRFAGDQRSATPASTFRTKSASRSSSSPCSRCTRRRPERL